MTVTRMRKLAMGLFTFVAGMLVVAASAYACTVAMGGVNHDLELTPNVGLSPATDVTPGDTLATDIPLAANGYCRAEENHCPNVTGTMSFSPALKYVPTCLTPPIPPVPSIPPCPVVPHVDPPISSHNSSPCGTGAVDLSGANQATRVSIPTVNVNEYTVPEAIMPVESNSLAPGLYTVCLDDTNGTDALTRNLLWNYFTVL